MPSLSGFYNWTISIIESIQPKYDGGILEYMSVNNFTGLDQVSFWEQWGTSTIAHKGIYLFVVIMGLIWAIILPLIFVSCWICLYRQWSCWAAVKRNIPAKLRDKKQPVKFVDKSYSKTTCCDFLFPYKSSRPISIGRRRRRIYYVQLFIISLTILLCFCCMCAMFVINSQVQGDMGSSNDDSISKALEDIIIYVHNFIRNAVIDSKKLVSSLLSSIIGDIHVFLPDTVFKFVYTLLDVLQVTRLFDSADIVFAELIKIISTMERINDVQRNFTESLYTYKGKLDTARDLLKEYLPDVCNNIRIYMPLDFKAYADCIFYKSKLNDLTINIDLNKVNLDSTKALVFILTQYELNVTLLEGEITKARVDLNNTAAEISSSLLTSLKLGNLPIELDKLWSTLDVELLPIYAMLDNIKNDSSVTQFTTIVSGLRIGIFIIPAILMLLFLIVIIFLIYQSLAFICDECHAPMLSDSSPTQSQIMLSTVDGGGFSMTPSLALSNSTLTNISFHRHKYSRPIYTCSPLIITIVIIVPAFGTVIFFLVGSILQTELCRYFTTSVGKSQINDIVDKFISQRWDSWIQAAFEALGNMIKDVDVSEFLDLSEPPDNILHNVLHFCSNSSLGILSALQFYPIIHIAPFLNSSLVQREIDKGRVMAQTEINKINAADIIPQGLEDTLKMASEMTHKLIDQVNYSDNIMEMQKQILTLDDPRPEIYFANFYDFLAYVKKSPMMVQMDQNGNLAVSFVMAKLLNDNIPLYLALQEMSSELTTKLILLQNSRNTTDQLGGFTQKMNLVQANLLNKRQLMQDVNEIYSRIISWALTQFVIIVEPYLYKLESNIIHCNLVVSAYSKFVNSVCYTFTNDLNVFTVVFGGLLVFYEMALIVLYFHLKKLERIDKSVESEC